MRDNNFEGDIKRPEGSESVTLPLEAYESVLLAAQESLNDLNIPARRSEILEALSNKLVAAFSSALDLASDPEEFIKYSLSSEGLFAILAEVHTEHKKDFGSITQMERINLLVEEELSFTKSMRKISATSVSIARIKIEALVNFTGFVLDDQKETKE